jgi:hypothetical protein
VRPRDVVGSTLKGLGLGGILAIAALGSAAAANGRSVVACGSLTIHASPTKSALETDITASGVTCTYVKKVFLPEAAISTPAAARFFAVWTIKARSLGGGVTEYTCRQGQKAISYRVKAG